MKYQLFHDLSAAELERLKADIAERGVVVPVVVDEDGAVIDGHQRRRAAAEVHAECPEVIVSGLTEDEKQALAIALNAFRRHLSGVERSQAIKRLRTLGMTQDQIAGQTGVHRSTVSRELAQPVRASAPTEHSSGSRDSEPERPEAAGQDEDAQPVRPEPSPAPNPAPPRITGRDGKSYPAQRAPHPRKASTTKAVALALYKLADAAEAFEAIDPRKLAEYASEVPVWSGNLAESLKAIDAFNSRLMEINK